MNKRIREKRARKYGYCPRCTSSNTASFSELYKSHGKWKNGPACNIMCFACGYGMSDEDWKKWLSGRGGKAGWNATETE